MSQTIEQIALCVERGKVNRASAYPPDMRGQDGADELTQAALAGGEKPESVLKGCVAGMQHIGELFSQNKAFIPEMLMAAQAVKAVMVHLKPHFQSGAVKRKGKIVMGTVAGDLHDIGKNIVAMVLEGNGWEVIDLGADVPVEKFVKAATDHPDCAVGLSTLLTTTMVNMAETVRQIKAKNSKTRILVGGAPVTQDYANQIGADGYAPDPQGAAELLSTLSTN
jgi:5-methyltetrahydrofolate--homocysteine methyltransferase